MMNIEDTEHSDFSPSAEGAQAVATPTKLQLHYLDLLGRLQNVKYAYQDDPEQEEWILQAIYKSNYSAFRSCVEHGVEEWAKSVLTVEPNND